jgi:hypothetical protein
MVLIPTLPVGSHAATLRVRSSGVGHGMAIPAFSINSAIARQGRFDW